METCSEDVIVQIEELNERIWLRECWWLLPSAVFGTIGWVLIIKTVFF